MVGKGGWKWRNVVLRARNRGSRKSRESRIYARERVRNEDRDEDTTGAPWSVFPFSLSPIRSPPHNHSPDKFPKIP